MDKLLHFIVGMAIGVGPIHPVDAFGLVVAAAIIKEVHDRKFDKRDAGATIAGGVVIFALRMEF
jgi:hypothetical protein